jgi:hypothetical protein
MFLYFIVILAAFVLIIIFFFFYYKKMTGVIFGKMNGIINALIANGAPPQEWGARLVRLNRKLADITDEKVRNKAVDAYVKYVEASARDIEEYTKKSAFLEGEEARTEAIAALGRAREEAIAALNTHAIKP